VASRFIRSIEDFSLAYNLGIIAKIKLILHYPLFKLLWLESYGNESSRAISRRLLPLFNGYAIHLRVAAKDGTDGQIRVPFAANDYASFAEVIMAEAYRDDYQNVETVVDLGANTGMASLWFLLRLPRLKKLVAVEPNPRLGSVIRKNVESYARGRFTLEEGCVSDSDQPFANLQLLDDNHRHTRIGFSDHGDVRNMRLAELLDRHGLPTVDLLKMDIEGSEYALLNDAKSLRRCSRIVAEIHGVPEDRGKFVAALGQIGFSVCRPGAVGGPCEMITATRTRSSD